MERLADLMFDWITVSWMQVSEREAHLLVVATVVCSSAYKGIAAKDRDLGPVGRAVVPFFSTIFTALLFSAFVLVLPGSWGFWVAAALALGMLGYTLFADDEDYDRREGITNLLFVVGIAVIFTLVALLWG